MSEQPPMFVCGCIFEFRGLSPSARTSGSHVEEWSCPEIMSSLWRCGHDSWACRMHRGEGTGVTAEQAFERAYKRLDAKSDEIHRILNLVHEKSGLKT